MVEFDPLITRLRPLRTLNLQEQTRASEVLDLYRLLYCKWFLRNYFTVVAPLTKLLKKEKEYVWSEECERSFVLATESLVNCSPIFF